MRAVAGKRYSLDEYLELEQHSEEKWEFWDGHVWCMSGASELHETIVSNLLFQLKRLLQTCRVYASNLKVGVPAYPPYRYPDLSVVCAKREVVKMGGMDVLTNPQLIVEVLSPSTEGFDRGHKFTYYKSNPSLTDYLLVSSDRPFVSHFHKSGDDWLYRDAEGDNGTLWLETFGIELLLAEIYEDIDLPYLLEPVDDGSDRAER